MFKKFYYIDHQLKVIGKTVDNKLVVRGVFNFYETHGLPLDVIFESLIVLNAVPDWLWLYIEAVDTGIKEERIIPILSQSISDTYGTEVRDVVVKNITDFVNKFPPCNSAG